MEAYGLEVGDCCCEVDYLCAGLVVEGWEGGGSGWEAEDCGEVGSCFGEIDVLFFVGVCHCCGADGWFRGCWEWLCVVDEVQVGVMCGVEQCG